MNGFQQSFINHHKSCELFCYFSSYYFPFQQPFHALNVLHPGCVTLKRSKLKKTNQETTSKTNNPPPPMPDKQKKKSPLSPPTLKENPPLDYYAQQTVSHPVPVLLYGTWIFILLQTEFEQIFFVSLCILTRFFFYYFCLLSVYPVRAGGK